MEQAPDAHWHNKVVVVTGGSQGLGYHIAAAFAARGAEVLLVARDAARLAAAQQELAGLPGNVTTWAQDVRDPQAAATVLDHVQQRYGRLDVLAQCVGKSSRGRAAETSAEQFQDLWELNFLALVRFAQRAVPLLQASRGSLIHIGSLASKSPGRFLGAYPASKYALAAYTHQLRLELSEIGVHVLLVCPGPLVRSDAGRRYAAQVGDLPPEAAAPGGGARVRGTDPAQLAEKIVAACQRRSPELVVPGKARWLFAIAQLWPRCGDWLLRRMTSTKST